MPTAEPPSANPNIPAKNGQIRVLCVDDHKLVLELMEKALREAGCQVALAGDGQAAWDRLCENPDAFDLVITDYQMPLLSGLGLVQRIRETAFHGRIIVQSGSMTSEAFDEFRALRVDRIVNKSLRPEAIVGVVAGLG